MKNRKAFWVSSKATIVIAILAATAPVAARAQDPGNWVGPLPDTKDIADDIVVTATLRSENLQNVPIAVTAFNAASLDKAGVRTISALDTVSASFNFNTTQSESGGATLRVRGVGTTGNNTGLESAVGIFLDGVYLSRPGIALGDLLDVEQIELLRGPQGTLFGRNTSAGALSIKTARPNMSRFEGFANATYGNYTLASGQGGLSAPLINGKLALRVSGAYRSQGGTVRSATTGAQSNNRNRYLIRGQLAWEPTADLSLRLIADYQKSNEKCCDAIIVQDSSLVGIGAYAAVDLPANGGVAVSGARAQETRQTNSEQFRDGVRQWGVSAQLDWELGGIDLVSITGYRDSHATTTQENDFTSLGVFSTSKGSNTNAGTRESFTNIQTFTQELRLSGDALSDRLHYLIGGYFADERITDRVTLTLGPDYQRYISANFIPFVGTALGPNPALLLAQNQSATGNFATNDFTQKSTNWSLFSNATFKLTDALGINVGLRYSHDRKRGAFKQVAARSTACLGALTNPALGAGSPLNSLQPLAVGLNCLPYAVQANIPGAPTPQEFDRVFSDSQLVYTTKLTWEAADNVNTYLSYSRGYKSGGFNLDPTAAIAGADPRFRSEKVSAYELGIKTKLIRNALTANLALFHQDLSNFQVLEFTGLQYVTFNVDRAKATGAEFEMTARVSPSLSVNAAYTYTNARFPKNCASATADVIVRSLCGDTLTNAPKHVVVAGFNYDHDIGHDLTIGLNGSVRLESDRRTSTLPVITAGNEVSTIRNPFDIQDGNAKINLRAAIGSESGLWRLEFWGNNITNVATRSVTFNIPLRGGSFLPGALNANGAGIARGSFLQDPRTYGVTLRTKF
jgi:iron complex outermembrane recepter protein